VPIEKQCSLTPDRQAGGSGKLSGEEDYSMDRQQQIINDNKIEAYAGKFLADHSRNTPVTDATLEKTYKDCVRPAKKELYNAIKQRIGEIRLDDRYKFYDDEE